MRFSFKEIIFLTIAILVVGIMIGFVIMDLISPEIDFDKKRPAAEIEALNYDIIYNECKSDSLTKTSYCLNDVLKDFYKYNISNIGADLTFDELKEIGGVCSHYSDYYSELGKMYGFQVETIRLPLPTIEGTKYAHKFVILHDPNQGYCLLDQKNIKCVKYDIELIGGN